MIKVIELFSGIGCQRQALKNINVNHEVIGISEIDKYAIDSYYQLHGKTFNFGDISKIKKLPKVDLWTYSFPCQDLSMAGNMKGMKKGTRSGLLHEVERLLEVSEKPKYLLLENVKNLVSKKFKKDFDKWCSKLEELGYRNYWKVLNAKDYGIPQNRERVFMVSILENKKFEFPEKIELKLLLRGFLEKEENVDKKRFINKSYTLTGKNIGIVAMKDDGNFEQGRRVYGINGYINTIPAKDRGVNNILLDDGRIRKITVREAWRLMGWKDKEFDAIKNIPNSQLYQQAGNGIVVKVLEKIFKNLFKQEGDIDVDM